MAVTITPVADLLDRGEGIADLKAIATAVTDVDTDFRNDGNIVAVIFNDDAGARLATLKATPDPYGRGGSGDNDVAISIPAGEVGFFPLMALGMFQTGGQTLTRIVFDAIANTSIALVRLNKAR